MGREVLTEKVTFKKRPEGNESTGRVDNWGRVGQAAGAARAKVLRQEGPKGRRHCRETSMLAQRW